ncbi:MAG: YjjW family glycine radical enzyme activase [Cetobacterium sp.]
MLKAKINKIIKFSNVDGPGNRMAIFFQGCNFNCSYCHNPETINICKNCFECIDLCPTGALSKVDEKVKWNQKVCVECDRCTKICRFDSSPKIIELTVEELLKEVEKVKSFIKGVTVSGGESTLHYKFITQFFKKVKEKWPNLTCFVDTNGSLNLKEEKYSEFIQNTDSFMLDVKAWNRKEHFELCGKDVDNIIENLNYLKNIKKLFEVRTVVLSNNIDNELIIKNVSAVIGDTDIRYKIIKYRNFGVRKELQEKLISPSNKELEMLEKLAKELKVKNTLII